VSGAHGSKRRPAGRQPPRHRRASPAVYRRRRLVAAAGALLAIGLIFVIVELASSGPSHTTAPPQTSTTTTTNVAPTIGIGKQTLTWTDSDPNAGLVVDPAPGGSAGPRTLVTEIWYPALGGSAATPTAGEKPDYSDGPFPVVVFAHGFDTLPATYTPLLASWVKAGFVVVAPVFPDENANKLESLGHPTLAEGQIAESDVVNEPYDIAYVVGQVEAGADGAASSGAKWLKGLVQPGKVALAGQSDGAQAVAALVYSGNYASTYDAMTARPFAVVILSGSELSGTYAPPTSPPEMLFVQSAADTCNLPQDASTLFHDAGGGFFLKLLGAHHFSPYVGQGPAAPIVETETGAYMKAAATGAPSFSALSKLVRPANIATLYPPGVSPALIDLPQPTPSERAAACAAPSSSP